MNIFSFFSLTGILLIMSSCGNPEKNSERIARRHCSSCHSFVSPELLDKETWENGIFPEMKFRMGLDFSRLHFTTDDELAEILRNLPAQPLISEDEFQMIQDYYVSNAPDTLISSVQYLHSPLQQFTASIHKLPISRNTLLTMIKYDSINRNLFVGTRMGKLFQLDQSFGLTDSLQLNSAPSDIIFSVTKTPILSCMGIMDPNDRSVGSIIQLNTNGGNPQTLIDSLKRPVSIEEADLNNDGKKDLVVSSFGHFSGTLQAYEQTTDGKYEMHTIHQFAGTRKAIVMDFTNDGLPDILALITQGDEQIALFTNRGNFKFSYKILLKFPPVYGSSSIGIFDFNNDSAPDILYTNGDNADYSPILKPYHGVRIFLNDGRNQFSESMFLPMHGASMATAADFDQDGDLDIAAVSFFPDFANHPDYGFIYFENENGNFKPFFTNLAASSRWIAIEAADVDNDHDLDLVLCALTFRPTVPDSLFQAWQKDPSSLLLLKNNLN